MKPKNFWLGILFVALLAACTPAIQETNEKLEATQVPRLSKTETTIGIESSIGNQNQGQSTTDQTPLIQKIEKIELSSVPDVDTGRHNVPLEEIIFDTFQPINRAVDLTKAQPALIRSLRDAIPPLYEPNFASIAETNQWLSDTDLVLGYADGDEAYAYPIKILNFHETVSHQVNGRDILASYCPLCRSGIVFDPVLPGTDIPLVLGNTSALYKSDMVMFDHQTGSYWNQVSGEAIVGPLTGQQMNILPAQMTTWGVWKDLYPGTLALSENTGFDRNYRSDPFADYGQGLNVGGRFFFPVSEAGLDPRLDPADIVLGLEVDGLHRAYPLALLGDAIVEDMIGETEVVIFSQAQGPSGAAFSPNLDGRKLTFIFEAGRIFDWETASVWNQAGMAIEGELTGAQLEPLPIRSTFWFSIVANFPDIEVYIPSG